MSLSIREWPHAERPRERLAGLSAQALATRELVAIVLGSGTEGKSSLDLASDLLGHFGGSLRRLAQADQAELQRVSGVGPARSSTIMAALELGRRAASERARKSPRIGGPRDVYRRLGPVLRDRRQEEFWVLYLDTQNRVVCERCLTVGILNSSLIHPREVFAPALARSAASVILAHNHPSGDPEPSPDDLQVTSQLVESGRLLGIPVRDHIVLGDGRFVSLLERGFISAASTNGGGPEAAGQAEP